MPYTPAQIFVLVDDIERYPEFVPWVGQAEVIERREREVIGRLEMPGQLFGNSGDRLPYSSKVSGSVSADQDFALSSGSTIFLGGTVSYVGDRKGNFQGTAVRETFPSYVQADLRTGLRYESWLVNVFVNNLTDKRGVLRGGLDAVVFPSYFTYIQPRTIGVSFSKSF